jgi:hypothetical protein
LAAGSVAAQTDEPLPEGERAVSQLAVVTAGGGSFEPDADGAGLLTLSGVDQAIWFTDRPYREAGVYGIDEMNGVFFADPEPPNAALDIISAADESHDVLILSLSSPSWDAAIGTLSFAAQVIDPAVVEVEGSPLAVQAERADPSIPRDFDLAALFIDDAEWVHRPEGPVA